MKLEEIFSVTCTVLSNCARPHGCHVYLLNSFREAKDFLMQTFLEDLSWDTQDYGSANVESVHDDDWEYDASLEPGNHRDHRILSVDGHHFRIIRNQAWMRYDVLLID